MRSSYTAVTRQGSARSAATAAPSARVAGRGSTLLGAEALVAQGPLLVALLARPSRLLVQHASGTILACVPLCTAPVALLDAGAGGVLLWADAAPGHRPLCARVALSAAATLATTADTCRAGAAAAAALGDAAACGPCAERAEAVAALALAAHEAAAPTPTAWAAAVAARSRAPPVVWQDSAFPPLLRCGVALMPLRHAAAATAPAAALAADAAAAHLALAVHPGAGEAAARFHAYTPLAAACAPLAAAARAADASRPTAEEPGDWLWRLLRVRAAQPYRAALHLARHTARAAQRHRV
jgi:hypothetical protein